MLGRETCEGKTKKEEERRDAGKKISVERRKRGKRREEKREVREKRRMRGGSEKRGEGEKIS